MGRSPDDIIHASAVSVAGKAVLLTGPSGSGKSAVAIDLLGLGADLISDDRTALWASDGQVLAGPAPRIAGLIEVRGMGLLRAPAPGPPCPVACVVKLDEVETDRLPPWRTTPVLGITLPCLHKIEGTHFPAAILQYLKCGRAH